MDKSDYLLSEYLDSWPPESDEDVDLAFRRASLELHPDQGGSVDKFNRVQKERRSLKGGYEDGGEESLSIDDLIGTAEIIESVYSNENTLGDYSLDHEVSDIWMGREKWSGQFTEHNSDMRFHLDIHLPFEVENPIEFEASYYINQQKIGDLEGQTSEVSDFIASNDLDEHSGYTQLVVNIGYHVLEGAEEKAGEYI